MLMKDFFKTKGVKVAIILAAVLIIILLSSLAFGNGTNVFSNTLRIISSPFEQGLTYIASYLEDIYSYMYDFDRLKAENEELKTQIAEIEEIVRQSKVSNAENQRLRELLKLHNSRPDMVFEDAAIVSWNSSNWSSTFIINKGSNTGIELYDCVITETGYLVGQVIEVGSTTSVVRTIIDAETSIGAIVDRTGISGVAEGDFFLMHEGCLKLSYLPAGADLINGDTVLTSGKGEVFPQGLVIGKITSAHKEETGLNWYGIIEPSAELSSLTQVFVVTDFKFPEEQA
ncbi:MAG: rod shape-determining protein MreC [Clostridiales bacterium]|jgi:rod shape-determining protein MreC|nr:rod shape-determining protein MreC [Clostridiales bacterium]